METATTGLGQVISDKTVQEIPLNGRHFTDLALLTTGTVTPPQNGFLSAPLRGQGSFGINTAGAREDTTNWLVNGINLNDPVQNQITFQPPIDTLAEERIIPCSRRSTAAMRGRWRIWLLVPVRIIITAKRLSFSATTRWMRGTFSILRRAQLARR